MNIGGARTYILEKLSRELSADLYYHGLHHTLDVVKAALNLARMESIVNSESLCLLETAALFHDCGFTRTYKEHEKAGCEVAREVLPQFDYSSAHIAVICNMIMTTKIPQSASEPLERVLCDADLDYLGRDDFESIAATLFDELKVRNFVTDLQAWNKIQVRFLEDHNYWTKSAHTLRDAGKKQHLEKIRRLIVL